MQLGGYTVDVLVQGHPGNTVCHGPARMKHDRAVARAGQGGAGRCRIVRHPPRLHDCDEALPGITAYAAPGHTPGCLIYVLHGLEQTTTIDPAV